MITNHPSHDTLRKALQQIVTFTDAEWANIQSAFITQSFHSKDIITEIGATENRLYFMLSGIIRLYCLNSKGEDTTVFLFNENLFASCYQSFLTRKPSDQGLEAIEDCILLSIDHSQLQRLYTDFPKMNIVTRIIAEQRFINAQQIFSSHIRHTPEERYRQFAEAHGDLLLRVPQQIIASFLGITPVSLSRIRKRISQG